MARKKRATQNHKFERLRKKTSIKNYKRLRTEETIPPEKIMDKVWARTGKILDQRLVHDIYKVIDEYILEKLIFEGSFSLEGFGKIYVSENFNLKIKLDPLLEQKIKKLKEE